MKATFQSTGRISILLIIFLSSLLILNFQGFSQKQRMRDIPPEDRAKRQTEMMKDALKLTPDQESKVSAINLKYAKKLNELRATTKDTSLLKKSAVNLNNQKDADLKKVLTVEQFTSYQKKMAELKAMRRSGNRQ